MSEPTLYNALKDIADAIRAKGITGTMSALEMPTKIASIVTGGSKYGITLDGLIGDVDGQGVLQAPSETFTFTSSDIVEVPDDMLDSFFSARDTITAVSLPNLTTVGEYGMKEICRDCEYLTSVNLASLTSIDNRGMEKAFQNCIALASLTMPNLTTVGNYGLSYAFASTYLSGDLDFSTITSIGNHGLEGLFQNCDHITGVDLSGLTTIPAYGLAYAFDDCDSLVAADLSNVATIGEGGMKSAFIESAIQSLSMPSLTTVGDNGLESAFFNCDSLTTLDLSGVTSIGTNGIKKMCSGCAVLTNVDMSSVKELNGLDYLEAFDQCPSLQEVDISGIETIDFLDATSVPTLTSTILFDNANNDYRIIVPDAIYNDWIVANYWSDQTVLPHIYNETVGYSFRLTAEQANSTISMTNINGGTTVDLEYSTDDGQTWNTFTVGSTTITLANIGDTAYIRAGANGNTTFCDMSGGTDKYCQFVMSGKLAAGGDIGYLLNQRGGTNNEQLAIGCFCHLFNGCSALTTAPELPSTNLNNYCYGDMFHGTSLTVAPELPATRVYDHSYWNMFAETSQLVKCPELPATTLGEGCYQGMFWKSKMTQGPDNSLPARNLPAACYQGMFNGCEWLDTSTKPIVLDFDTVTTNSLRQLFQSGYKITKIKLTNYTGGFGDTSFYRWVYGVPGTGTFYYNGSDTTRGSNGIPTGWTVQTFTP